MKRTLLTKEAVKNAIDSIKQQGIYPSLEKIRKITGGSSQRISQIRKEIEKEVEKEVEKEATPQTDYKEPSQDNKRLEQDILFSNNNKLEQDAFFRIETRMAQMELLFTQRLSEIDTRLAAKYSDEKEATIEKLQQQIKKLEAKNSLLINQLNQELMRVKELSLTLKQAKTRMIELEAALTAILPKTVKAIKRQNSEELEVEDSVIPIAIEKEEIEKEEIEVGEQSQQAVIHQFNALLNAEWGSEQNAEIAMQKAARQYLTEKWPTDSHLLSSAVLDSKINEKSYVAVSISNDVGAEKPYVIHGLILDRETERLSSQRKEYIRSKAAQERAHQWLNI